MSEDKGRIRTRGFASVETPASSHHGKQGLYIAPQLSTTTAKLPGTESSRIPTLGLGEDAKDKLIKATISPNVTPRSSLRRARADNISIRSTPEVTPVITPESSRPASVLVPKVTPAQNRPTRSASNSSRATASSNLMMVQTYKKPDTPAKFFFASEVPLKKSRSPVIKPRDRPFIYTNDRDEVGTVSDLEPRKRESRRPSRSPDPWQDVPPVSNAPSEKRRISSRSTRIIPSPTTNVHADRPKSTPEQSLRVRASSDLRILSRTIRGAAPRSKSPLKPFEIGRQPQLSDVQERRRYSIDSSPSASRQSSGAHTKHTKCSSITSIGSAQQGYDAVHSAPILPGLISQPSPLSPVRPLVPPIASIDSPTRSPTIAKRMSLSLNSEEGNMVVTDARRERKILDLEISNSSLLSFNRLLERENRRLKAEVRRHRRLTTMSAFTDATNVSLSTYTTAHEINEDFSANDLESGTDSDGRVETPSTMSDGQQAERKVKDERRVQRDFATHRRLLDDSRNMDSSIRRCTETTDMLITEAKKALDCGVAIDVQDSEGCRVLQSDELGEEVELGSGLLGGVQDAEILWDQLRPKCSVIGIEDEIDKSATR